MSLVHHCTCCVLVAATGARQAPYPKLYAASASVVDIDGASFVLTLNLLAKVVGVKRPSDGGVEKAEVSSGVSSDRRPNGNRRFDSRASPPTADAPHRSSTLKMLEKRARIGSRPSRTRSSGASHSSSTS